MSEELKPCPCCGGEARAQFEVYGTWVRVFCGVRIVHDERADPQFDPTPATVLWNKRVENDKPA